MRLWTLQIIIFSALILGGCSSCSSAELCNPRTDEECVQKTIELPDGFSITVWADDVPNARSMVISDDGTVYVGTRKGAKGYVYAVRDTDGDGKADSVIHVDEGLTSPNGVDLRDGDLYVAERSRVLRYDDIDNNLDNPPDPVVINDTFPTDKSHGWKFMKFGPDGKLYVPVGAPCNICNPDDERYASIMRMNPDGSDLEVHAHGIRNTVGFDWHPETGDLWFTDNGRDRMGDNIPPDELNHITEPDQHFGYPFCHGGDVLDPEFGEPGDCDKYRPPVQKLGPHVAALGMRFYTADMFPNEYKNQIFIAEHGSWNRSEKIGYRVMLVKLDDEGNALSYEPFAKGWLQDEEAWGRPVDVEIMKDGSLLVSDDFAGVIYRIAYE